MRVSNSKNQEIEFSTPIMSLAWGAAVKEENGRSMGSSLCMKFDGAAPGTPLAEFQTFLGKMQGKVLTLMTENSKKLTGKQMSEEDLQALAPKGLILNGGGPDSSFAPSFKPKICHTKLPDGTWDYEVMVYDPTQVRFLVLV
jgi:hypothetical protein